MVLSKPACKKRVSTGRRLLHADPSESRCHRHCATVQSLWRTLRCAQKPQDRIGCALREHGDRYVDCECVDKSWRCGDRGGNTGTIECKTPRNRCGLKTTRPAAFSGNNFRCARDSRFAPAAEFFRSAFGGTSRCKAGSRPTVENGDARSTASVFPTVRRRRRFAHCTEQVFDIVVGLTRQ